MIIQDGNGNATCDTCGARQACTGWLLKEVGDDVGSCGKEKPEESSDE
jgi:hypothetical protein